MYLFELYQEILKKKRNDVKPFNAVETWPDEWKTIESKVYERFPLISLPSQH